MAQEAVAARPTAPVAAPAPATLPIGVGDMLEVDVFDTAELSGRLRVNEHGEIALAVGGTINVLGLTSEQASRAVENQLKSTDMMLHPSVSITIVEFANQGVTVMGEVRSPGVYPYLGTKSLFDFITSAGGLAPTASKSVTVIHRRNPEEIQNVDISDPNGRFSVANVSVWPGDTIVVKKAGIFYMLGAVGRPGAYLVDNNQRVSVLEALALASGAGPTAKLSKTRLIRKTSTGKEDLPLPLNQIIANKIPDSPLQDGDIVFVPSSALKMTAVGMLPSLASSAIYRVP
jgi:polysaccharide export outer membrane protein